MAADIRMSRQLLAWFKELPLEQKATVLSELQKDYEETKGAEISALEARLATLKGTPARPSIKSNGKGGHHLKGTKVPPKYRDKAGNQWTGRGVKPKWVRDYLKKGKLEDLLISKS